VADNQLDRQWIKDIKNTLSVQATIEPEKLGAWDLMEQMVCRMYKWVHTVPGQ